MIKISVIIPIYNMENYLKECLDSILFQTLKEIEVICVDDGSTDCSYDILLEYRNRYNNIIVLQQENQGPGPAKNKGIEYASGKYVAFMDPDDYYAQSDVLELLYINAEKNAVKVCGGNIVSFDENGKIQKRQKWFDKNGMILFQNFGCILYYTRYIYDLEMLRDHNIIFPPYRRFDDPPFLLNVMTHAKEFYVIKEVVYMYRVGHKKVTFNQEIINELLRGVRDCFQLAYESNLNKVYDEYLKNYLRNSLTLLYPFLNNGNTEGWKWIFEINEISLKWMGECDEVFLDREHMVAYISNIKEKRSNMLDKCHKARETVIYGAGKIGNGFLEKYGSICRNIVGFAVTSKSEEEHFIAGYAVKEIGNYDREALVVVAVGEKSAQEILQNLEMLQFQNVCYVKYSELMLDS
ncbi:MAG: glycosyltransferase [Lachnospiraceae bacterium]|nr:glycosyltransferase [Lachnospiraceae bacterium]